MIKHRNRNIKGQWEPINLGSCKHCERIARYDDGSFGGLCGAHHKKLKKYGDPLFEYSDFQKTPEYKHYLTDNWRLIKHFGITLSQYADIAKSQDYKCLICERHKDEIVNDLHVDHCHKTGKIRGLLCITCNMGLGSFKDDPRLFDNAKEYLNKVPKHPGLYRRTRKDREKYTNEGV